MLRWRRRRHGQSGPDPPQPGVRASHPPHTTARLISLAKSHTPRKERRRERGSGGHDRRCVPCCCLKEEREEKQAHPYRNKRERQREKGKQRETRTREGEEEREVLVVLPVQVLQPTPEVPRRGPAGTPTDTSKRVSDGEGEERQGRSHFLTLPDMHKHRTEAKGNQRIRSSKPNISRRRSRLCVLLCRALER